MLILRWLSGLSLLLPLALGAPVAAQLRSSLETETTVGVRAGSFTPLVDSLPARTPQSGLRTLSTVYSGAGSASARTTFATPVDGDVTIGWAARATADFSFGTAASTFGDGTSSQQVFLWTLRGVGRGELVVDLAAERVDPVPNPFATATLDLDVGADGSDELRFGNAGLPSTTLQRRIPLVLEPGVATVVRLRATNAASAASMFRSASSSMSCRLRFEAAPVRPAQIAYYGNACGTTLGVADAIQSGGVHRLTFTAMSTLPNEAMAFVFGSEQVAVPIGASGCTLYLEPVAVVYATADGTGRAAMALDVPGPQRATAYVQAFALEIGGDWFASRGARIGFED